MQNQANNFFDNFIKVNLDLGKESHVILFETLSFLEKLYISADDLQLTALKTLIDTSKKLNTRITIVPIEVSNSEHPGSWSPYERIINIQIPTQISETQQKIYDLSKQVYDLSKQMAILLNKSGHTEPEPDMPDTPKCACLKIIIHELCNSANEYFQYDKYSVTEQIMSRIYELCSFSPAGTYLTYKSILSKEPQFNVKLMQQPFIHRTKYIYEYAEYASSKQKTIVFNQISENFPKISSKFQPHEIIPITKKMTEETFEENWERSLVPDLETGLTHASAYKRTCPIM